MSPEADRLLNEALQLPEDERATLADQIYRSLEPADSDDAYWETEIAQRIEEDDRGLAKPIPWEEARRMLAESANEPDGS
jgi:putative addiction module component (TIGR02574 family)